MRRAFTARVVLAIASVIVSVPTSARADDTAAASAEPALSAEARELREARSQIDATLVQMRATALRVRDELRLTRKRGTRAQITCVDDALSRSDTAVRRARETGEEVLAAYARGDVDTARALRTRLSEIREGQRLAAAESAWCAPPIVVAKAGVTTVKLQIDPRIAPAP